MTSALSTPGSGLEMTSEMNDSHCPSISETSSFLEEMSWVIISDFPIVPAIITVCALELLINVGPVKFCVGPRVYLFSYQQIFLEPNGVWREMG